MELATTFPPNGLMTGVPVHAGVAIAVKLGHSHIDDPRVWIGNQGRGVTSVSRVCRLDH